MSAIPALAAAMAAILLQLRPGGLGGSVRDRDEFRLCLVAATLAVLLR